MANESILESHPTEFFRNLVQTAMVAQQFTSEEETEFYLVHLLERHIRMRGEILDRPLGVAFLEATQANPPERFERFRSVGDTALFVSGLFTDSLEGTLVQPAYYVDLGRSAYQRVAEASQSRLRQMFQALAAQFSDLVRVLGEISVSELFASDRDTLRIYRRWLFTRGSADAAKLVRRGVIPSEPSRSRH
jgi:hypothetical protein